MTNREAARLNFRIVRTQNKRLILNSFRPSPVTSYQRISATCKEPSESQDTYRPSCCGVSRKLQADCECGRIAIGRCRRRKHKLVTAAPEDTIMLVPGDALSLRGIRLVSVDAIC